MPTNLSFSDARQLIPYIDLEVGVEFVLSSNMTYGEKVLHPTHETIGGYLKEHTLPINEVFPKAWVKLTDEEKWKWTILPNFDADKFLSITGVDVRKKDTRTIVIDDTAIDISEESYKSLKKSLGI